MEGGTVGLFVTAFGFKLSPKCQLNHLAQRSLEEAAVHTSRAVTALHVQRALELLPWVAQLAR